MLSALLHVFELAGLAGTWTFAGYALLPRSVRDGEPLRTWSSAFAIGAGATAVALMVLAASHALGRTSVLVVTGGGVALAVAGLAQARRQRALRWPGLPSGWPERLALLVLAGILGATLFATLAPPSSMDATVYHLRVPREFLRTGTWNALEDVHSFQPLYVQLLFGQGLVLGGGVLAALVHWAFGVAAIAAAAAWARRLGGRPVWAALVFGAMALFVWESTSAFIDLSLALFSSLALLWATEPERSRATVILAGAFAGLAAGCKFTGAVAAVLTAAAAMAAVWPDRRRGLGRLVAIGALTAAIALPWYVRNFVFTGNPIFPLAHELFGQPGLPPPMALSGMVYGLGTDVLHLVTSPFDLIARGETFDQGWSVGPAYLALCPIGLWASRRARLTWIVAAVIGVWWLVWFYSSPQTRLLLPVLPVAAGLAGVGMRVVLDEGATYVRLAAYAVLGVAIAGGLGMSGLFVSISAKAVLGIESAADFLSRSSWHYVAYDKANRLLPADAKVAVEEVHNLYYLEREARFFIKEPQPAATLRERGFTHKLSVVDCPRPAADATSNVIWEGSYPLRFSRTRGGVRNMACARLESLSAR